MKSVSRWFTLVSVVAVGIVAAGCGSDSTSGPSEVVSGVTAEAQDTVAFTKAAVTIQTAGELELVGFVKSVATPRFTVAGRTIVVTGATEIKRNKARVTFSAIKVGEHVKVEGVVQSDGKVLAREIKVAYQGSTPNTLPDDHRGRGRGRGSDDDSNHDSGDDHGGHGNDDGPGDDHGGHGNDDEPGDDHGNHGSDHD